MVLLCVGIKAKEGQAEAYLREVREKGLHEKTLLEPGCHQYDFFRSAEDPDLVLLVEKWESEEAFQGHLQGENLKVFVELQKAYTVDMKADRYTV